MNYNSIHLISYYMNNLKSIIKIWRVSNMKWFMKMNDEEFAYMNECSADIVFSVEHDLDNKDEEKSIIYVDELIDACDKYCKNWSTIDELEFKNFTSQHMLWFCLTYVRYHDENYKMEFDDWDRAMDLEEELENL